MHVGRGVDDSSSVGSKSSNDVNSSQGDIVKQVQQQYAERETPHWQSSILRNASTPLEVVEGLDSVLMTSRIVSQENIINEMHRRNMELEESLKQLSLKTGVYDSDLEVKGDDRLNILWEKIRIERNSAEKRLELNQISLNEAECDLRRARKKNLTLEQTIQELSRRLQNSLVCSQCGKIDSSTPSKIDGDEDEHTSDEDSDDVSSGEIHGKTNATNRVKSKISRLQRAINSSNAFRTKSAELESLLRERTSQVRNMHCI
jgi:hypothetical protein